MRSGERLCQDRGSHCGQDRDTQGAAADPAQDGYQWEEYAGNRGVVGRNASEAELQKRTLTNLYNERTTWLRLVHEKLDRAVLNAYVWPHDLTDEQILERLLELNLERASRSRSKQ
jgi:hypothetical protein